MNNTNDRPYPARQGRLPRHQHEITPQWLTSLLQHRYPGIEVNNFDIVDIKNSHTTKMRITLDLNDIGLAAGIPRQVCLKSNWSEGFESGDICELEARFYFLMRNELQAPVPKVYYADMDTINILTKGKTPRRTVKLGEGARPISSGLRHLLRDRAST